MNTIYYETKISICFKEDIPQEKSQEVISKAINAAMLLDEELKLNHKENMFKGYIYCSPYPIETSRIYYAGKVYLFRLRSIDLNFILKIKNLLPRRDEYFKVLAFELYNCKHRYIDKISTLTPAVATLYNRNWVKEDGLETIRVNIHNNAVKKAKHFSKQTFAEPKENFIEFIIQTNRTPIKIPYKDGSMLGNKFDLAVKTDAASQELAQIVLGTGLLEKNSLGCGFCIISK